MVCSACFICPALASATVVLISQKPKTQPGDSISHSQHRVRGRVLCPPFMDAALCCGWAARTPGAELTPTQPTQTEPVHSCSAAFYVREEIGGRRRSLAQEAALAALAASCLGFGTVFLLLWCGVYLG